MTIEARFQLQKAQFNLDVDLSIPKRGITAIFGPSGCGKTTLLRAIAGLEHSPRGYLKIGEEIWQDGDIFLPTHQRPLGYVFQEASLFDHLSVRSNVEYGLKRIPMDERQVSLDQAIELLGISQLMDRRPDQLSGGEKQRVSIARAIAVSPKILLMDEPLSALDYQRKREIMPYLESLQQQLEIPILYVSHSPDEVARLAQQMVLLDAGKVQAVGPMTELLTRLDLPLAHYDKAGALVEATVAGHDDDFELTHLDFPGGRFSIGRQQLTVGQSVRIRVTARDVSLTLEHQQGTSILNVFPVTIDEIIPGDKTRVTVRLNAGGVPLLSRVTRKSVTALDLKPGKQIFAQVKTVALLS
ncbi:MAG: molybdenum ABC transporter ATP-binding protein [Motiliproteus sp.]|nr:molybdenum ABC transporter ATP-binding protein [Motiliproteus sp.]MCW9054027.1 molybdenum ABC transporter ATP-binding protein [Motiliproteus sp.]